MTPGRESASGKEASSDKKPRTQLVGAGLGAELAGSLIGCTLVGVWIDHSYNTGPWATLIAVTIGFIGGFYNFIRSSLRVLRTPQSRFKRPQTDGKDLKPRDG